MFPSSPRIIEIGIPNVYNQSTRYRGENQFRIQEVQVKQSKYKSYDELPLFLNAALVAEVLGIAPSSAYELMHEKEFPMLKVGSRMVVPKERFIEWVERNTGGGCECGTD